MKRAMKMIIICILMLGLYRVPIKASETSITMPSSMFIYLEEGDEILNNFLCSHLMPEDNGRMELSGEEWNTGVNYQDNSKNISYPVAIGGVVIAAVLCSLIVVYIKRSNAGVWRNRAQKRLQ